MPKNTFPRFTSSTDLLLLALRWGESGEFFDFVDVVIEIVELWQIESE